MLNNYRSCDKLPFPLLLLGFILHYLLPASALLISDTCLVVAVLCHSTHLFGLKTSVMYMIIAMVMGFLAEFIGINTGLIFGAYHYSPDNQAMLLGVPFFVPFLYFPLLYAGNFMCFSINKNLTDKKNLWVLALVTGTILMLKDIVTDPLQSTVLNLWIWDNGGEYFGVPVHNFIGWFAVFAIMTVVTLHFTWHKKNLLNKVQINKSTLLFPVILFSVFVFFGFTSAFNVPDLYRNLGHVSAFAAVFFLGPYILLAWFNGIKA